MQSKECNICRKVKTLRCFMYSENSTGGFTRVCRKCTSKKVKEYKEKRKAVKDEIRHFRWNKPNVILLGSKKEAYYTESELIEGIKPYTFDGLSKTEKEIYLKCDTK